MKTIMILGAALALAVPASAVAADNRLELWLNPSITIELDDSSFVELETGQRLRASPADDTYYTRLWYGREIAEDVKVSAGVERRFEGSGRETRLLQQIAYPLGPLKGRTRLEQRFLSDDPRTGWRLRQRLGADIPLSSKDGGWTLVGNAEGFFTLRSPSQGGQDGLTGLRTFVGFERALGRFELSFGYLRQQTIRKSAPDAVGHAPFLGLTLAL
jgi:Protein of unknown function (DUF2490)